MPSGVWSDFKELVRTRTDLVQLVGERVALQSRRGGREFVGLCPFHDDHNPSLRVEPDRQSYKCWSCGEGGDCFAFVQKMENVGFVEALEFLATRAGLELPRQERNADGASDGRPTRKELFEALAWAAAEYHTHLRTSADAAVPREYLASRGFSGETIARFHLGFAPADGQFLQRRSRGRFKPQQLAAAKLVLERSDGNGFYDYFRGRVMFPIRDASARTVAFGGRVLPGPAAEGSPKYINSADSPLFAKSRLVFALDLAREAIGQRGAALVTEGYADCIMAHQYGLSNAVATLGTALTDNHVSVLKRFTRKVVLVFDGDRAGRDAAEKSLPRFLAQDIDLRILTLTEAKDPADFLTAKGAEPFQRLIDGAVEAWEYQLNLCIERFGLASVDARDQVLQTTLEAFKQSPALLRSGRFDLVLNRLAFRTGADERRIREILARSPRPQRAAPVAIGGPVGGSAGGPIGGNLPGAGSLRMGGRVPGRGASQVGGVESTSAAGAIAGGRVESATPCSEMLANSRLESELLELILSDPTTIVAIRQHVLLDDIKHEPHRRLLEACYRLADEETHLDYEKLMASIEDADLKRLVVTLDDAARAERIPRKLREEREQNSNAYALNKPGSTEPRSNTNGTTEHTVPGHGGNQTAGNEKGLPADGLRIDRGEAGSPAGGGAVSFPSSAGLLSQSGLLSETIGRLKRRRRTEAHEVSKGRLAIQPKSGASGGNSSGRGPSEMGQLEPGQSETGQSENGQAKTGQAGTGPTLDAAQIELLRRAMEIHGERATSRTI